MLSPELRELAEIAGVFTEYWDVNAQQVFAEEETVRELLTALGCDSRPGREAAEKQRLIDENWSDILAPFVVFQQGSEHLDIQITARDSECPEFDCLKIVEEESGRGVQRIDLRLAEETPEASRLIKGEQFSRFKLTARCALPLGYFRLQLFHAGRVSADVRLLSAPAYCYQLPNDGKRHWGLAAQVYSLWDQGSSSVGSYSDVGELFTFIRKQGASVLGLNPLHALGGGNSSFISPYFPSTRAAYNFLYVDTKRYFRDWGLESKKLLSKEVPEDFVDYERAFAEKREELDVLFAAVSRARSVECKKALKEFKLYQVSCDEGVKNFALFHALEEHFVSRGVLGGWRAWPEAFRRPETAEVEAFQKIQHERISFYLFAEWLCELDLARVTDWSSLEGEETPLGLYLDLALGARDDGAEVWSQQEAYVSKVSMGAPPDELAPQGQDWGLPPLHPKKLIESEFDAFISVLRANMKYAGAIRIDHVMSLFRLYWRSSVTEKGAYVAYPLDELMAIIALESVKSRCVVIGEDLGTVPPAVTEAMLRVKMFSYKVLFFMRAEDGGFVAPDHYHELSLAVGSTHDLPTLAAYMHADDVSLREEIGLLDEETARSWRETRTSDLGRLKSTLTAWTDRDSIETAEQLTESAHQFLAKTPARIAMLQLEDLNLERRQINLPGTSTERRNWSIRSPRPLGEIAGDEVIARNLRRVSQLRKEAR